jgi:hypothetical protein
MDIQIRIGSPGDPIFIGDTTRFFVEFRNVGGEHLMMDNVTLKIYDDRRKLIDEFPVRPHPRGKYRRDYTIPEEPLGKLSVEFSGEIEGIIFLKREPVDRVWAVPLPGEA